MASDNQLSRNERIIAILESPEGLRNPALARELALRNSMGADHAIRILAQVPAEESPYLKAIAKEARLDITSPSIGPYDTQAKKEVRRAEIIKNVAGKIA